MRHCRIDAYHQVEIVDEGRRIGKVMQILGEIMELHGRGWIGRFSRGRALLQREEPHARNIAKPRQCAESDRAATVFNDLAEIASSVTGPAKSDPQTIKTGKPLAPVRDIGR